MLCLGWCDSNQLPHWFANVAGPARPKTRDAELQNSWVHLRAGMASSDGMLSQKGSFESLMPAWSFKSFMRAFALRDHTAVTIDVIPSIRLAGLSPFFILMLAVVLGSRSKADVNGGGGSEPMSLWKAMTWHKTCALFYKMRLVCVLVCHGCSLRRFYGIAAQTRWADPLLRGGLEICRAFSGGEKGVLLTTPIAETF